MSDPYTTADAIAECAEDLSSPGHGRTMCSEGVYEAQRAMRLNLAAVPDANECEECGNLLIERDDARTAMLAMGKDAHELRRLGRDLYFLLRGRFTYRQRKAAHRLLELDLPPEGVR